MIISYGGKNCWSFKDWFEINLSINKNVPKEYGFSNVNVLPVSCFIGPNATGKSNALRVLTFIRDFVLDSFNKKPDDSLDYLPFFLDASDFTNFYIKFYVDKDYKNEYKYDLKLKPNKIYSEVLSVKNKTGKKIIFRRLQNKIMVNDLFKNNDQIILRNNASFISTLHQYGIQEIEKFYRTFLSINSNVTLYETYNEPYDVYDSKYYYENSGMLERVKKIIDMFDTEIVDINVKELTVPGKDKEIKTYISFFKHKTKTGSSELPIFFQSLGTKALYSNMCNVLEALDKGGLYIYDELECHLHPTIVLEIINYFMDKNINRNGAQLIFTTHNLTIMEKLKKYNVYVFGKEDGESYCYRIDELRDGGFIRNDKSLPEIYWQGFIGGLPNVKKE